MEKNVGAADGIVRVTLGAILGVASLAILGGVVETTAVLSPILGVVALILLVTGLTGTCGLYSLLGIATN